MDGLSEVIFNVPNWLLTISMRADSQSAYNVGSDEGCALAEHASNVAKVLSVNKPVIVQNHVNASSGSRSVYMPDIKHTCEQLGLDVWTSLDDAIINHGQLITRKEM